jgi:hypothetical protein
MPCGNAASSVVSGLAFAEMLRSYPDLTVAKFKQAMVLSNATENLRKLGLPD